MWNKSKIDFEQLRIELRSMTNRYELYKVVKEELEKRGWWKQKPRGKPNYDIKSFKNGIKQ